MAQRLCLPLLMVLGLGLPSLAQPSPYVPPKAVDLDRLPEAFLLAEYEFVSTTGSAIHDGADGVSSWDLLFDHLAPYPSDRSPYATGREAAFMAKVHQAAPRGSRVRLGPDDLYRLSLEVNQGNRFEALVTVHDALKKTGRAIQVGEATEADMRALVSDAFFDYYTQRLGRPYRPMDANRLGEAYLSRILSPIGYTQDYTGKYYHLFGTATGNLVGGVAGFAHIPHAALMNVKTMADAKAREQLEFYGDNAFGRLMARLARPTMAVATGFGSYGGYTTLYRHKYLADLAGAEVGDVLADAPDRAANALRSDRLGALGGFEGSLRD